MPLQFVAKCWMQYWYVLNAYQVICLSNFWFLHNTIFIGFMYAVHLCFQKHNKTMLVSLFHSISNLMCSISIKNKFDFFENLSLDDVDYHVWYNNRCHRVNWHVYFFILNNKLIFVGPRSTYLVFYLYWSFVFLITWRRTRLKF